MYYLSKFSIQFPAQNFFRIWHIRPYNWTERNIPILYSWIFHGEQIFIFWEYKRDWKNYVKWKNCTVHKILRLMNTPTFKWKSQCFLWVSQKFPDPIGNLSIIFYQLATIQEAIVASIHWWNQKQVAMWTHHHCLILMVIFVHIDIMMLYAATTVKDFSSAELNTQLS